MGIVELLSVSNNICLARNRFFLYLITFSETDGLFTRLLDFHIMTDPRDDFIVMGSLLLGLTNPFAALLGIYFGNESAPLTLKVSESMTEKGTFLQERLFA
jgi:hypothetical protein